MPLKPVTSEILHENHVIIGIIWKHISFSIVNFGYFDCLNGPCSCASIDSLLSKDGSIKLSTFVLFVIIIKIESACFFTGYVSYYLVLFLFQQKQTSLVYRLRSCKSIYRML